MKMKGDIRERLHSRTITEICRKKKEQGGGEGGLEWVMVFPRLHLLINSHVLG